MQTVILHIDMNSYFASCEQQDNFAWRGKPVGVCEHLGGIIIGASVEAKRWGITTGTPVWEARKLYPKIILTKTNPDRYRFYTARFLKVFADYTNDIDKYSIDEAFLNVTRICNINNRTYKTNRTDGANREFNAFDEAIRVAKEIKKRMKPEVGDWLRCSVGIGTNKLIAKIASELQKPDGLSVVYPSCDSCSPVARPFMGWSSVSLLAPWERMSVRRTGEGAVVDTTSSATHPLLLSAPSGKAEEERGTRLQPMNRHTTENKSALFTICKCQLYKKLKLIDIPGIGKRQERNLNDLGIMTLEDLKNFPKSKLVARFGILGHHLYNMGQLEGSWKEGFKEGDIKSIGHMYTLPQEFRKRDVALPVMYKLSEMVAKRLRDQELMGNVISFFVHTHGWEGFGKSSKLTYYLYDGRDIFLECLNIFKSFPATSEIKLIGITVSGLIPFYLQQSLFGEEEKKTRINHALDAVNEKYEDFTLTRAWALKAGKVIRDSVGFGRMKEFGN